MIRAATLILFLALYSCFPNVQREIIENGVDVSPFDTFAGQKLASQRFTSVGWPKIPRCHLIFQDNGKLQVIIFRQLASNDQERLSVELKYEFIKKFLVINDANGKRFKTTDERGGKYILIKTLAILETKLEKPKEEIECKIGFENGSFVIVIHTHTLLDFKKIP